jgi:type I restriction enzyme S subunit
VSSLVPFEDAVEDVSAGNSKVQRGNYLPLGRYPIVDQGQAYIGGYSNDETFLVDGTGPWIVFGDHTRAVKFVDFPFCMGADGVKVLRPRANAGVHAKYLYYFLSATEIPSAGYSRHFKFLKRLEIPLPPLPEQRRIAAILDKADALRRKRQRAIDLLDSLTQSIFMEMFGDPIENPYKLPVKSLEEVVSGSRKITYGILKPGPDQADGVPYIRVVDIQNGSVVVEGLKRTTKEIAHEYRRSTLRRGDLLISIRGHVGRLAIVPSECHGANITQDTARLAVEAANTVFVKAQLETEPGRNWMDRRTKGAAVKGINLGDLRRFPLILPSRQVQDDFATRVAAIQKIVEAASFHRSCGGSLFASLQHRAFSGQL